MSQCRWQRIRLAVVSLAMLGVMVVLNPSTTLAVVIPKFTGYVPDRFAIVNFAVLTPFDLSHILVSDGLVPRRGGGLTRSETEDYLHPSKYSSGSVLELESEGIT